MKTYRLAVSMFYRVWVFSILSFVTLTVPLLYLWNIGDLESRQRPPGFVIPLFLLVMAWNWSVVLRLPYLIRAHDDGRIDIVSLVCTTVVTPQQLVSLSPSVFGGGFYTLRHRDGKLRLMLQFTGLHEFLSTVKAANPEFETRGC